MPVIIVERSFVTPPSETDLKAFAERQAQCQKIYGVAWKQSVLSSDRKRMVCRYDAPDAESVRKVQRQAGGAFDAIWVGNVIE